MGQVRGVVFDLDGTLVVQHLDFEAMRREIGLPSGTPLLEALGRMDEPERIAAHEILLRHERAAAERAEPHAGVVAFLTWLDARGVRRAVLSRNTREAVEIALARCGLAFDVVVAREDAAHKPSPEGVWKICDLWQFHPSEVAVVGDYVYDIEAGRNAGARTALVTHGKPWPFAELADLCFPHFEEIPDTLRGWFGH